MNNIFFFLAAACNDCIDSCGEQRHRCEEDSLLRDMCRKTCNTCLNDDPGAGNCLLALTNQRWMVFNLFVLKQHGHVFALLHMNNTILTMKINATVHELHIKSFITPAHHAEACNELSFPTPRYCACRQHYSFRRNVAEVASSWQQCIFFDQPEV